jgi:riboflavin synthase
MFTGLITAIGRIERVSESEAGLEFRVHCDYSDLQDGESIAVNGACLTVRDHGPDFFTCAAVTTTLERTTIGSWKVGASVNLERALKASDRVGGHFVLGHVDAVAEVVEIAVHGNARLVEIALPASLSPLVIPHGSIAIDGVSLTVNALRDPANVQLSLIEYTLRNTALSGLKVGHTVNVEMDVLGKYIQRMTSATASFSSQFPH